MQGEHDWAVPWIMRKAVGYIKDRYNNFPQFITQTGKEERFLGFRVLAMEPKIWKHRKKTEVCRCVCI
jgi:hypothetical protein